MVRPAFGHRFCVAWVSCSSTDAGPIRGFSPPPKGDHSECIASVRHAFAILYVPSAETKGEAKMFIAYSRQERDVPGIPECPNTCPSTPDSDSLRPPTLTPLERSSRCCGAAPGNTPPGRKTARIVRPLLGNCSDPERSPPHPFPG